MIVLTVLGWLVILALAAGLTASGLICLFFGWAICASGPNWTAYTLLLLGTAFCAATWYLTPFTIAFGVQP